MFIINITYTANLEQIDAIIEKHVTFLNEQYELGNFIASGRKVPRTGGIILSNINSKTELEKIIEKDPFKTNQLADYDMIEFIPTKASEALHFLLEESNF